MIVAIMTLASSVTGLVLAAEGGLPPWVGIGLTPAVVIALILSGQLVQGKHYDAMEKRAIDAETRERDSAKATLPALESSARAMDQMMSYLKGKGSS